MLDGVRFRHEDVHLADRTGRRVYERIFRIDIGLMIRRPFSQGTQGRPGKSNVRGFTVAAQPE